MNYFEKKSVRVPPTKAFGRRDPKKIERIGIAKFRKLNDGKNPEYGQEFMKKGTGQRGVVSNISQGKVIIDYNHPLAGQSIDYNIEVIDKIEDFNGKLEYFMISKGIPKENVHDFNVKYNEDDKSLEITIPKMFLFQNLTYVKFGLAMDLQTHMADEIEEVKFIEVYEKMPVPETPQDSVMQKVEEFNKEQEKEEISKEKGEK
jgi:peptidylprolyl isomerase